VVAGGAVLLSRPMPLSKLDGTWETPDKSKVLYVDTKAKTLGLEATGTYTEERGPITVTGDLNSTTEWGLVTYEAKWFGTISVKCPEFEVRIKSAPLCIGGKIQISAVQGDSPIVGDSPGARQVYRRQ
jgi:hypothetical protein